MPSHLRDDVSFMYLHHPQYYHYEDSKLDIARNWFRRHEEVIFDYYAKRNEYLQKNNMVMGEILFVRFPRRLHLRKIIVTGKLEAQNYAFLINHKGCPDEVCGQIVRIRIELSVDTNHSTMQIRFYVFYRAVKGEKWGDFARYEDKTVKDGDIEHITKSPNPNRSTCRVSAVRSSRAPTKAVMLQCIRMNVKSGREGAE